MDDLLDRGTWLGTLAVVLLAVVVAAAIVALVRFVMRRLGRRTPWVAELAGRIRVPGVGLAATSAIWIALAISAPAHQPWWPGVAHLLLILTVLVGGWFIADLVSFGFETAIANEEETSDAGSRRRRTQLVVLHRVSLVVIGVLALGVVLFSFETMRVVGTSLLASAGIVSIVAGLAAQSLLGNFIAGIQLAFTDAIKVGDVVVVEGEWGRIGEINLSYVVVYIWDERRLVLPCSYFTSTPFETWTRAGDQVLGLVVMDLDWRVPMAPLRAKFQEVIEAMPEWDRRSSSVWVTGSEGGYVKVRFAMSAANAGDQWVLRCTVREEIMTWMQQEHPEALPTTRVEFPGAR